jgi:DNA-binding NtrC family response regulator
MRHRKHGGIVLVLLGYHAVTAAARRAISLAVAPFMPRAVAAHSILDQRSAGIERRNFHTRTKETDTPASSAKVSMVGQSPMMSDIAVMTRQLHIAIRIAICDFALTSK